MRRILALALGLAWPAPLAAQEAAETTLTLLEAARLALETHPSVEAAAAREEAAAASRREASAAWLPDLTLDADYTRFEEPMLVTPLHAFDLTQRPTFDRDVVQATLASRWTLFDGGERAGSVGRAAALEDAAGADLDESESRLLATVTSAYLAVLTSRETVRAHDARLEALEEEKERVLRSIREEKAARVEASRVEAAVAEARAERVSAVEGLDVATRDLARLIGHDDLGPAGVDSLAGALVPPIAGPVDRGTPADMLALDQRLPGGADSLRAIADTPALRRARSEVRAARAARTAARGLWIPDLQLASGFIERGALDESYTGEWQVGLELRYPLFTGGARRAAVSRAGAELRAAEERLRLAELETAARIDRALAAFEAARAAAAARSAAVEHFEEVFRVEKLALDVGAGVVSDYLDALADLFEARAAEIEARHAVLEAEVELARATGVLDLEWLAERLEERR